MIWLIENRVWRNGLFHLLINTGAGEIIGLTLKYILSRDSEQNIHYVECKLGATITLHCVYHKTQPPESSSNTGGRNEEDLTLI